MSSRGLAGLRAFRGRNSLGSIVASGLRFLDMKSLVLALPLVAASGLAAAEPGAGASIDEDLGPRVLLAKPFPTRVWEDVAPDRVAHAANTNKIFLNRCAGGCFVTQGTTNSTTNRSSILRVGQTTMSAFSR